MDYGMMQYALADCVSVLCTDQAKWDASNGRWLVVCQESAALLHACCARCSRRGEGTKGEEGGAGGGCVMHSLAALDGLCRATDAGRVRIQ
jgi:hypothetical protein